MFWTSVYFISSCLLVLSLVFCVRRTQAKLRLWHCLGLILAISVPILPYGVVLFQTVNYGSLLTPDVRQALQDTGLSDGKFTLLRVLLLTPTHTNVYVEEPCNAWPKIHPNDRTASVLHLRREAGKWKLIYSDSVWSDCGSATGNTFPPYLNANEF